MPYKLQSGLLRTERFNFLKHHKLKKEAVSKRQPLFLTQLLQPENQKYTCFRTNGYPTIFEFLDCTPLYLFEHCRSTLIDKYKLLKLDFQE